MEIKEIIKNNYACNVNLLHSEKDSIEKWKCSVCQTEKQMIQVDATDYANWPISCELCDVPIRSQAANSNWKNEQVDESGKPVVLIRMAHINCVALTLNVPNRPACLNCGWWQSQVYTKNTVL